MGDTPSYLNYHENVFKGEVNASRTPVYPYFIKISSFLFGNQIRGTIISQSILSEISILFFLLISIRLFSSRLIVKLATLFYSISPSLASWDKCILTESLSLSLIVITIWIVIRFIDNPRATKLILINLMMLVLIFTRPSFILLIPVIGLFWLILYWYRHISRQLLLFGLAGQLLIISLITWYSHANYVQNGCYAMSNIPMSNVLRILAENNLHLKGNNPEIILMLEAKLNGDTCDKSITDFSTSQVNSFAISAITKQPVEFALVCFKKFFILNSSTISVHFARHKPQFLLYLIPRLFLAITSIPFYLIHLALVSVLFDYRRSWKTKNLSVIQILLFLLVIQQLAMIYLTAPSEYFRLFVPAIPAAILLCFKIIDQLMTGTKRSRAVTANQNSDSH